MKQELQVQLSQMSLAEFRVWYAIPENADKLPIFHNSLWLADQADPVLEVYQSMLVWVKKRPILNVIIDIQGQLW